MTPTRKPARNRTLSPARDPAKMHIISALPRQQIGMEPATGIRRLDAPVPDASQFVRHPFRSKTVYGMNGNQMRRIEQRHLDDRRNDDGIPGVVRPNCLRGELQHGVMNVQPIIETPLPREFCNSFRFDIVRTLVGNKNDGLPGRYACRTNPRPFSIDRIEELLEDLLEDRYQPLMSCRRFQIGVQPFNFRDRTEQIRPGLDPKNFPIGYSSAGVSFR